MDEGNPKASVLYIVSDSPLNSSIQFSRIQNPLKLSRKEEKKMEWNIKQDEYDFRKLVSSLYVYVSSLYVYVCGYTQLYAHVCSDIRCVCCSRSSQKYLRNANKKVYTLPSKPGMHFNARVNNCLSTQAIAYVVGTLAK